MSKRLPRAGVSLVLGLALSACGPSAGPGGGDAGAGSDGGGGSDGGVSAPDLSGSWESENVSQTPDTMGFHAQLSFLASGELHLGWAEVDAENLGDMDVTAAERSGGSWSSTPLTDDELQHTYTSMTTDGEKLYLVWSGRESSQDDYDIYLAVYDGGSWSLPSDLTTGFEGADRPRDVRPDVALAPDGDLVVAYTSGADSLSSTEIRVIRGRRGDVAEPVTAIAGSEGSCDDASVAVSPAGDAHVVANCNGLHHATDESGSWESRALSLATSAVTEISPDVEASADGLHLVFRGDIPCGDSDCGDIFYARRPAGGNFGRVINVSESDAVMDILPVLAVDPWDRILVAYKARGEGDADDSALFSYSEGGETFSAPRDVTPDSTGTDDEPTDLSFHPETGLPAMSLLRTFSGSDPLNIDVFTAELLPDAS